MSDDFQIPSTGTPSVYFVIEGALYRLDHDLHGGYLVMPRRHRVLATALLGFALENIESAASS